MTNPADSPQPMVFVYATIFRNLSGEPDTFILADLFTSNGEGRVGLYTAPPPEPELVKELRELIAKFDGTPCAVADLLTAILARHTP